jgi:hypothetical protein
MYAPRGGPSGSRESEDERLARRLQEEEERSLSNTLSNHSPLSSLSAQERDDMMLARQMQEMDSFGQGAGGSSNNSDPSRYRRDQLIAGYDGGQRNLGGRDPSGIYAGYPANNSLAGIPAAGDDREDRLAYARRLQEQAFQRMQAVAEPPKSTEEADLELAMKMQIEEGGAADHSCKSEQEDEDMQLARFMEESGVSIRELDAEGLAAAKEGSANSLLGSLSSEGRGGLSSSSSLGLGASAASGGGIGGGLLGGLYGSRRDDDSDEESIEIGFGGGNQKIPAVVSPLSVPPVSRSNAAPPGMPSLISAAIPDTIPTVTGIPLPVAEPAVPSTIPPVAPAPAKPPANRQNAMPPPASNRKKPPPGSSQVASIALPGGRQASIRLSPTPNRGDFHRQAAKATDSSGPGANSGGRTGLSRMLPSPSKSFGTPRGGTRDNPTRKTPPHTQSANNLLGLRNAAKNAPRPDRSVSPNRRQKGRKEHRRGRSGDLNLLADDLMLGDLPPGVNMASAKDPLALAPGAGETQASTPVKKKKGKLLQRIFGGNKINSDAKSNVPLSDIPDAIPAAIPGPPGGGASGPLPHSVSGSRNINQNSLHTSINSQEQKKKQKCANCGGESGKMLGAMEKKFHVECFRCMACSEIIDWSTVFAVTVDQMGESHALHRKCYAEFYGVHCTVCNKAIPANVDGSVSYIKHPFFTTEQMCPRHSKEHGRRRCTGCHRFEPEDEPFVDLNDGDRCVCYACCRTVIMNNMDVKPLWSEVLRFFEFQLGLPIWDEMREIPILVVGQAALNENQLRDGKSVHGTSSQIMTRGLCLSEHDGSMCFRVPSQRFNDSTASFEACNHTGFMDFNVGPPKGNTNSEVMAILCLSGLPRDLTASVLAHEATHAWIKLHPDFKVRRSIPAQVEEGCAQLVAYLFLSDGLEAPRRQSGSDPSDEKLRQYFKFSIETDDNDIYGEGYRQAAHAYSTIGIEALLNHVVHYQEFPQC